jgi:hypothetical protein
MNPKKYLLPLALSIGLVVAANCSAQTPAAAAPEPRARPADGKPLFGDDFESGALNPKMWLPRIGGSATVTVDKSKVAHGTYALHIHYPAGVTSSATWAFAGTLLPESLRDHFYGRAYVYISGLSTAHNVFLLSGSVGFPLADFLEIGGSTVRGVDTFQPSFQLNIVPAAPGRPRSEVVAHEGTIPTGRWFCLEWEFTDKPEDRIVEWVDGVEVANKTFAYDPMKGTNIISSGLVQGFKEIDFGYRSWGMIAKDIDIYYDDIAISDKPIGQLTPVPAPAAAATDTKEASVSEKVAATTPAN